MQVESSFNPAIYQNLNDINLGGSGYTIVQVDPAEHFIRFLEKDGNRLFTHEELEEAVSLSEKEEILAKRLNEYIMEDPKRMMDAQLEFIIQSSMYKDNPDLMDKYKYEDEDFNRFKKWFSTTNNSSPAKLEYEEYIKISPSDYTPEEAALIFVASYERTSNHHPERQKYAREWKEFFNGKD